jgi:chloramphenicol O-acetyltransferase type A
MNQFSLRRDRFEFFESFENPLLNVCFELEVPDFRPYCKAHELPVFHFFLYQLFMALEESDNFKYRIFQGEVIKIEKIIASYTVINEHNLFNYTRFESHPDLRTFIARSLAAKTEALKSSELVNTGIELSERDLKNYVFITSLPWLKFTSIEHPVYKFKSADIPSVSWGKFTTGESGVLKIPFSVQAHHGFVDAFHIHQLAEKIHKKISDTIL